MIERLLNNSIIKFCLIIFFISGSTYIGKAMTIGFSQPGNTLICSHDTLVFKVLNPANKAPNGYTWTVNDFFGNPIVSFTNQVDSIVFNGFPSEIADYDYTTISVYADSAGSPISTTYDFTLQRYPSPEVYLGPDRKLCPGTQTFLYNISSPGINSYTFKWYINPANVLATTETYLTATAGKYYYEVKDAVPTQGCITKRTINVISFGKPTMTAISQSGKPVRCFGQELTLDVRTDQESTGPYHYHWQYAAGLPTSVVTDSVNSAVTLSSTSPNNQTYNVIIRDANTCTTSSSITIKVNPALTTDVIPTDITLCKYNSAVLTTTSFGGSVTGVGYTYSWSPAQGLSDPNTVSPTVTPLEFDGIVYTVTGKDVSNCTATDVVIVRKARLALSFKNYSHDTIALCGGSVLGFNAGRKWGMPGYTFTWNSISTNLVRVNDTTYTSEPVNVSSKFYVMVKDTNSCTDKDSLIVNIIPAPVPNIGNHDKIACLGGTLQVNVAPVSGDSYSYNWYNNSNISQDVPTPDISNNQAPNPVFPAAKVESTRQYKLVVTDNLTRCTSTDLINIITSPLPKFNIISPKTTDKVFIQTLTDFTTDATPDLSLAWSIDNIPGTIVPGPTAQYSFDSVKVYNIILSGTNGLGCTRIDTLRLRVKRQSSQSFYIPNVFTPASLDARNKSFRIFDDSEEISSEDFSIQIYNVVGQLIFSQIYEKGKNEDALKKMKEDGWNGSGYTQGLYTYYIKGKYADDTEFTKTGGVTLLK